MSSRAFLQDKTEVLTLAVTASKFSKLPSQLAGIQDESIARAFDFECAEILYRFEMEQAIEREKRQYELLTGQALSTTEQPSQRKDKVEHW